jgi:hypothetical protein
MKLFKLIFILLAAFSLRAQEWTKTDTTLEIAGQLFTLADWSQTSTFHREPMNETNWALGHHPAQRTINRYFIGLMLGHYVVSRSLHGNGRRAWQLATLTIEAGYVNHNVQIGAKFSW